MATCHSLRVVDGELLGDPLDVKMFQFTGWAYEEGGGQPSEPTSPKFDTISPSVARPPVTHFGDVQHSGLSVRDLIFPVRMIAHKLYCRFPWNLESCAISNLFLSCDVQVWSFDNLVTTAPAFLSRVPLKVSRTFAFLKPVRFRPPFQLLEVRVNFSSSSI